MLNRLGSFVRSLISWLGATFLVCACLAGFYYFQRADEELRRHVENVLAKTYPAHHVSIGAAHFVQGEGIRLRKVSIVEPSTQQQPDRAEVAFCDEVVLYCTPTMEQLLKGHVDVDRVRMRGLWLQPTRRRDNSWNLETLLPAQTSERKMPTIVLENARVEIVDRSTDHPKVITFGNIAATITPPHLSEQRDGRIAVYGQFANEHLKSAEVWAKIHPDSRAWEAQATMLDLQCDAALWRILPRPVAPQTFPLDGFAARVNLGISAAQGAAETFPRFEILGSLFAGRFDAPRFLTDPITDITASKIRIARTDKDVGWQVEDVKAKYGVTELALAMQSPTLTFDDNVQVVASARSLQITHELVSILPEKQQTIWAKYKPLGIVDAELWATKTSGAWRVTNSNVNCRDVSLNCVYFPYPVVRSRGTVHFRQDEKLTADLWVSVDHASDRTPIHIVADIDTPGPKFTGGVNVKSHDWLPMDNRLAEALKPSVRNILADMEARGEITFDAHLSRQRGDMQFDKNIAVDVRDAGLRYKTFPYPLQDVRGQILVEDNVWTFRDFVGQNDSCVVKAAGNWLPNGQVDGDGQSPGELRLDFVATDIPCDEELRTALPPGPQQIWQSLHPTGHIDHAKIKLVHRQGMTKPELDVVVTQRNRDDDPLRRSLEIQPTWFPLRLNRVTGIVDYKRDGTFRLHNILAAHGSAQRSVTLQSTGGGVFRDDGTWEIELQRVIADNLETTPELTSALPSELASAMRNLEFQGKISVDGSMRFTGDSQPGSFVESSWSSLLNVDNASLNIGERELRSVYGEVRVEGQKNRSGTLNRGVLDDVSLLCDGVQVARLSTPWMLDGQRLVFGAAATANSNASTPATSPQHLTARVFGGTAQADGLVGMQDNFPFRFDMALADFNVAEMARELAMPSNISGRGEARLQLAGTAEGTHTLGGKGSVRLRDANLAKLPEIISLVNTMSVRNTRADVFTSSDIDLTIEGPYLNLNRFDLHGESLTLKGRGWIALDRRLNLDFYTILGGEKSWLPLARQIVGQASQRFLQITAEGTIDNMRWSRQILPGLAGLNELFPEQVRQAAQR